MMTNVIAVIKYFIVEDRYKTKKNAQNHYTIITGLSLLTLLSYLLFSNCRKTYDISKWVDTDPKWFFDAPLWFVCPPLTSDRSTCPYIWNGTKLGVLYFLCALLFFVLFFCFVLALFFTFLPAFCFFMTKIPFSNWSGWSVWWSFRK